MTTIFNFLLKHRYWALAFFGLGLLLVALLVVAGLHFEIKPQVLLENFLDWLEDGHWGWLVGALIFCPLAGFPISPFYILSGVKFGFSGGILISFACLFVHLVLAYLISARACRGIVLYGMKRFFPDASLPVIPQKDEVKWILFVRIAPGIPLVVQNYSLGLARVRFLPYLLLSMPIQMVFAVAFILFGHAVFSGTIGTAVMGVSGAIALLILFNLLAKFVVRKYRMRQIQVADEKN
jgi:uncharacterized membrane protein YdjX (TVP38/TMEM64 family)